MVGDGTEGVVVELTEHTSAIGRALSLHRGSGALIPSVEATAQRLMSIVGVDVTQVNLTHHKQEWIVAGVFEIRCTQNFRVEARRVLEETCVSCKKVNRVRHYH